VSLKYQVRAAELRYWSSDSSACFKHCLSDLLRMMGLLSKAEVKLVEASCGLYEKEMEVPNTCCPWAPARRKNVQTVDYNRVRSSNHSETSPKNVFSPSKARRPSNFGVFPTDVTSGNDSDEEEVVGLGGLAMPLLMLQLLRSVLMRPLAQTWGYPERFLQVFEPSLHYATLSYQRFEQLVRCPVPFPYLQLCRALLVVFLLSYPLGINLELGIWGNIFTPTLLAMALLGIDRVAHIVENPIGDHSAALSLYELIHTFESEVEATFNMSEESVQGFPHDWHELGHHFELHQGAELVPKPARKASVIPTRFTDFFIWQELPELTVQYIKLQSGTTTTIAETLPTTLQARLTPQSLEAPFIEVQDDVFAFDRCVALKDHSRVSRRTKRHSTELAHRMVDVARSILSQRRPSH